MPVESAADRLAFLNVDEFAATATYTPAAGGGSSSVQGIFDNDFLQVDTPGGESSVATLAPRFVCRTADLSSGGAFGDTLVIAGTTYKARVIQPDGTGMTTLWLEKQ